MTREGSAARKPTGNTVPRTIGTSPKISPGLRTPTTRSIPSICWTGSIRPSRTANSAPSPPCGAAYSPATRLMSAAAREGRPRADASRPANSAISPISSAVTIVRHPAAVRGLSRRQPYRCSRRRMTRRRTGNERPVTTASSVPVTREEEVGGDEALETLGRTGRIRLALDAVVRFRAADGFSHSRALAFQITLAILPGIIAVVGLAATLDVDAFTRVVRETIRELAPGAVGDILTDALRQGTTAAREDSGETALVGGALAAAIAGTTAMAQVERGANRIYGTERDRPFLRKYFNAALLAATAGTLAVASAALLVGGSAIRSALEWGDTFDAVWSIARWPVGAALTIASVALLFERAPRRRQPEA